MDRLLHPSVPYVLCSVGGVNSGETSWDHVLAVSLSTPDIDCYLGTAASAPGLQKEERALEARSAQQDELLLAWFKHHYELLGRAGAPRRSSVAIERGSADGDVDGARRWFPGAHMAGR